MEDRIRVVVGLGNPGSDYSATRHNIGFRLLDRLGRDLRATSVRDAGEYQVMWARAGGRRVALVKPMLFMNRSGDALARFPESALAGPEGHLIVLDDVWIPFGTMRFRTGGGPGGHKGLASVLERFGTEDVPRLRLGVGGAETEDDLVDYVLKSFSEDEEKSVATWLEKASEGVRVFLAEGPNTAMSRYNG